MLNAMLLTRCYSVHHRGSRELSRLPALWHSCNAGQYHATERWEYIGVEYAQERSQRCACTIRVLQKNGMVVFVAAVGVDVEAPPGPGIMLGMTGIG